MSVKKSVDSFIQGVRSDLAMYGHALCSDLAHTISDEMAKEYQYVIDLFYNEYTPKYYNRHYGLYKTSQKPHGNTAYWGGIIISDENMPNVYHDTQADVLKSFLSGYHGRPSLMIFSSIQPYRHMVAFCDYIMQNIDYYIDKSDKKARLLPYSYLKI